MKSLVSLAVLSALCAWLLWELRPPHYEPFTPAGYESPYLVLALHSAVILSVLAALLAGVLLLHRGAAEFVRPWSSDWLMRTQLGVLACAAAAGIYGLRSVLQLRSQLVPYGDDHRPWFFDGAAPTLALSPWILFAAVAIVSVAVSRTSGLIRAGVLAFDLLTILYLAIFFSHVGTWTCLSCSGPLG